MIPLATTPESEGVSSARLADFIDRFFSLRWTHGLVVLRHGRIVAECYRELCSPADRHQLFSLSKSFTSSAVGIALGEGLIPSLDAPLVSFFPEYDSPRVTDRMRRVTLRHLLCMGMGRASCGLWGDRYDRLHREFDASPAASDMRAVAERFASGLEFFDDGIPAVRHLLEDELRDEPGSRFEYNTGATFLLSAVLQKVAGRRLPDYLRSRLFDPLGIARDVVWDDLPGTGIALGGAGLSLAVREIAAAGDLWLCGGVLRDGRRLIPASYMAEATAKQIDNDGPGRTPEWCQGYGYQFWRCRHGAFRGDGASGQLAVMLPEQDAVVAATAGVCGMQEELDAIWETLLPAFAAAPLPPDPSGLARLREAEASQRFDLGPAGGPRPDALPFGEPRRFACAPNPFGLSALSLAQDGRGATLEFAFGDGLVDLLRAGWDAPRASQLRRLASGRSFGAFARAAWIAPARLRITAAVPCSTSFFTLEFDLAASRFRSRTPIWFAHPWMGDVTVPLERVLP
ncbi:MAG: serine hydrolase [Kiritimatiellae bacterium]|nr:serine hydrolase [Kiritimatiellia bacterium]